VEVVAVDSEVADDVVQVAVVAAEAEDRRISVTNEKQMTV